ncbi:hypothetical protein [Streptosporangium saharense]|uniref:hypothetical protein n=1 Tax=Streptosporangium saharense TaxID=1706840 RepID=UPI003319EEAE
MPGALFFHQTRARPGQVRLLEQKLEEPQKAHMYLMHPLERPDNDDILGECPWLDGELMSHAPRGSTGTVGAAMTALAA